MKKIKFYPSIWQPYPFTAALYQMDGEGRPIKDVVLINSYADELSVSIMTLIIEKIAVLQSRGQEQIIAGFPGQASLLIKGMYAGDYLWSKSILSLEPGTYTTLRFYLGKSGNKFMYSDRSVESADGLEYLDFDFERGLTIEGNESPEAILRFDLAPFKQRNLFTSIRELLKRPHIVEETYRQAKV